MVTDTSQAQTPDNSSAQEDGSQKTVEAGTGTQAQAVDTTKELENKLQEAEKKYLYLYSEFENFRRRNERDRLDFIKFGHEGFLKELLQVVDNFERAIQHAKSMNPEKGSPLALVNQGVEMIHFQFMEVLRSQGVSIIAAVGSKFDPAFHEAVGEEEGNGEAGVIIRIAQAGYLLHGRLLRAAKVIVTKKKD